MDPLATPAAAPVRVLVVEDDPDDARHTFRALRRSGRFEPVHARTATEALEQAVAGAFGACLLDFRLPDMSGIELCRRLRELGIATPVVLLSSVESDSAADRAARAGADDFLVKHLRYGETLEAEMSRILEARHGCA
ncbi:MAG TPA: response regulator [Candidatus Thermoplasmatota archaeon]|nr:response regulator [Candidatus Thermoplasmatota archaeon]